MTKKLTDTQIDGLKKDIAAWSKAEGRLTWEAICERVQARFGHTYTRQGLAKIESIRIAYDIRTKKLRETSSTSTDASTELARALERIDRLQAERDQLRAENRAILEQFVVWTYNASTRGLDAQFLNRPLPPIDRDATPGEPSATGRKRRAKVRP